MTKPSREIVFPGKGKYSVSWLLEDKQGQALLAQWRPLQKQNRPYCNCNSSFGQRPEMVIRLLQSGSHTIAKMPETGHRHVRGQCDFHVDQKPLGGGREYVGAIERHEDHTAIAVNFPLQKADPRDPAEPAARQDAATGRVQRHKMGLGGLLSQLWEDADLNNWIGGDVRPWVRTHGKLQSAAQQTRLGTRPLHEHLFIQPEKGPWLPPTPADIGKDGAYYLLLFKVNHVDETKYENGFLHTSLGDKLMMKKPVLASMRSRYRRSWPPGEIRPLQRAAASKQAPTVICLGLAQWETLRQQPQLVITQAACMMTNARGIPVESSHELEVADLLVAQRRSFSKPLRYDAEEDVVFPDFILNDAGADGVPMEVYGMSGNAKYDARKLKKREYYRESGKPFWEWTPGEPMPTFPRATWL